MTTKVNVDIDVLKRKIANCHRKADAEGYEENVQYWMGRAGAYMDILCSHLGITDNMKQMELENEIIEKY